MLVEPPPLSSLPVFVSCPGMCWSSSPGPTLRLQTQADGEIWEVVSSQRDLLSDILIHSFICIGHSTHHQPQSQTSSILTPQQDNAAIHTLHSTWCPTTCWRAALMTCLGKNPRNCLFTIDLLLLLVIYVPPRNNNRYEKIIWNILFVLLSQQVLRPFSSKYFQSQGENWMELYQFLLLIYPSRQLSVDLSLLEYWI